MASIYRDNVFETSTTTGTGALTLAGAVTGARTFQAAFGAGPVTVGYVIRSAVEDGQFETGIGSFASGVLTRTTVRESSNANAAVNWGAGTRNVWCAPAGLDIGGLGERVINAGTSSGTNTIVVTPVPAITAYAEGTVFVFEAGGTVTGAATFNASGVGAIAVQKLGAALVANDITAADMVVGVIRDVAGTKTLQIVSAPRIVAASDTVAGIVKLLTPAEVVTGTDTTRAATAAGIAAQYSAITRAVNTQTGTTYTFVLTDAGKLCTFSNAAAITVTVPPNSSVAFAIGAQIDVAALGAGQVTLAQGAGVTISSEDSKKKLTKQYSSGTLVKTATDLWLLVGSLTT